MFDMLKIQHNVHPGRRQLLGIIALFLLPPMLAWAAWYYLNTHGVSSTSNAGTLIQPARPLPEGGLSDSQTGEPQDVSDLRGRWLYVMYAGADCAERCREQLYVTRQIRIGVNKDISRVRRLLVVQQSLAPELRAELIQQHPDLIIVQPDANVQSPDWQQPFQDIRFDTSGEYYFLVDPLGNLMMFYDLMVPAKGVRKDLQKLLKVSQIG
ncbi:MAG: hypothetical protein AAF669_01645 [Pseudomonadota bacterium]